MSDSSEKKGLAGFTDSPFFNLARPYFDFIGKGTMFSIVYYLMAIVSILLPIAVIVIAAQNGIFSVGGKYVVWFILSWLFIAAAGWVGFQLWWNRRIQVMDVKESEFVAIPIIADMVRTFGEWIGTLLAVVGFGAGLFGLLILGDELTMMLSMIGMDQFGGGLVVAGPVAGFFIILFARLVAEAMKLFVSIANSCKDIAKK
ncbi:MAG: hypothetical protein FWC01_08700 [Treponema sp.]|nr:hypothetical protein [Treponema sp.]MCL2238030.1 hypothetical protein [Treponema sp.]